MTLRPIRPEDEPLVREAIAELEPETARPRFLGPVADLSHDSAARLTQIDYDRELLLALLDGKRLVALGRLGADPDDVRADIELTARSGEMRDGALDVLLDALVAEARARRIGALTVHLEATDAASARYRPHGFSPPPMREEIEEWVMELSAEHGA